MGRNDAQEAVKGAHYRNGGPDVIEFSECQFPDAELKGFHRINVLKYVTRYDRKGTPLADLRKAAFYLDKLIELEERDEAHEQVDESATAAGAAGAG